MPSHRRSGCTDSTRRARCWKSDRGPAKKPCAPRTCWRSIEREGAQIATVMLPGVQFLNGQRFDLRAIAQQARRAGCRVGFDLAHAIGNMPLELHDCGADFAVWCHYKYLNAGPGAIGGCFVHERHARDFDLVASRRLVGTRQGEPLRRCRTRCSRCRAPRAGRFPICPFSRPHRSWPRSRSSTASECRAARQIAAADRLPGIPVARAAGGRR